MGNSTCGDPMDDSTHQEGEKECAHIQKKARAKREMGTKPEGFLKYGLIIKYFKASSAFLTNI